MSTFDLLSTVQIGGCSAKLSADALSEALADLPKISHPNLLVDIETHDDAGVFKISDDMALIQTTDFFPPVCSNPYDFGQIAAANALSDVYAMGGEVLTVLNIVAFPAHIPLWVLKEILRGGIDKVKEAGGVVMGGHTIVDDIPKFGMAVTGTVHPDKIITNNAAQVGDVLILTKPIGSGIVMAGHKIGEANDEALNIVLESMKRLNKEAVPIMQKYDVKCATDITGFGLLGHALKMAIASELTLMIEIGNLPIFNEVNYLIDLGCIPGACFRNLAYVEKHIEFNPKISYTQKMLAVDAQTSGGLLICCKEKFATQMLNDLQNAGYIQATCIGRVVNKINKAVLIS